MARLTLKKLWWTLVPVAAGTSALIATSCGAITDALIEHYAANLVQQPLVTNSDGQDANSPYKLADNLTYSLQFKAGSTMHWGTGWLFDYAVDTNNSTSTFTGYFATNLHVAQFAPSATEFALGKRTNSSTTITYENISGTGSSTTTNKTPQVVYTGMRVAQNSSDNGFVDFAVLEVQIQTSSTAYTNWINNSKTALDAIAKSSYTNLFADPNNTNNDLSLQRAFIGAYPAQTNVATSSTSTGGTNNQTTTTPQAWTINEIASPTPTFRGQTFDTNDTAKALRIQNENGTDVIFKGGKYDTFDVSVANSRVSESVVYNGVAAYQEGPGYVIDNSNLKPGASGAAVFNADKKIIGIYFGAWTLNNEDVQFGLMQPLIVNEQMVRSDPNAYAIGTYDLIAGATNSYHQALIKANKSTYLFPLQTTS